MFQIGPLGFAQPWLLLAAIALPLLILLLRAIPPAPIRRRFPGVALLLGLTDDSVQTDRTPWWLLLLRMLALAAIIVGFAGPVLNPENREQGTGPLLILTDGSWAEANDWTARMSRIEALVANAGRQGRTVAVASLTDLPADGPVFQSAEAAERLIGAIRPSAWQPDDAEVTEWVAALDGDFDTYWLSDGLDRATRSVIADLEDHGAVTVFERLRPVYGLHPARFDDGAISIDVLRSLPSEDPVTIAAIGRDPAGVERELSRQPVTFPEGALAATLTFDLPPEIRNRLTRFEIIGQPTAGAVSLTDDSLKRREIALIPSGASQEGLQLLSPLHYLREALAPNAELIEVPLADAIPANPDIIILTDTAALPQQEAEALSAWVDVGGMLVRFAGPRLASSDISRTGEDDLLPVRLRTGGRTVGGTMSWGEPKALAPFKDGSPFIGLQIPDDVTVSTQVVAQPDPTLADRVIAELADGTPLVTRKESGAGQIVLFHVTANAEWSTLPLSGLFPAMLERLAIAVRPAAPDAAEFEGTIWSLDQRLLADGGLAREDETVAYEGEVIATGKVGPDLPPGLYRGQDRLLAVNTITADQTLTAANWPNGTDIERPQAAEERDLSVWFLISALILLTLDVIGTLGLTGRLRHAATVLIALFVLQPHHAQAQDEDLIRAASEVVLAHVLTGDDGLDEMAHQGLYGLSDMLFRRTSVEPGRPMGVDLETDELSVFPLLYWPVNADQPLPSAEAYAKLNRYLATGGMILFDTRDADRATYGNTTAEGRKLQAIAAGLDIPPLEPVPADHILTRTFYLLQDFPGRYNGQIWAEASDPAAQQIEGMPFRNLNDGVTPVVIGGNDWAAAWAANDYGQPIYPVGRGSAGQQQREISYRFGINLVMNVLTGNYKSDQVHVPDLLDRLGQ